MASRRIDLYGIKNMTLDDARASVEQALGISLAEDNSSHYGGVYYRYRSDPGKEIKLFSNYDADKEEWLNETAKGYLILFNVTDLDGMDGIQERLVSATKEIEVLGSSIINADFADMNRTP